MTTEPMVQISQKTYDWFVFVVAYLKEASVISGGCRVCGESEKRPERIIAHRTDEYFCPLSLYEDIPPNTRSDIEKKQMQLREADEEFSGDYY